MSNNTTKIGEELIQLVSFKLGDEEFGVNIQKVKEINRMIQITKVPNAPSFVKGVVNLRGSIMPIIDLRKKLNMPPKEDDKSTRIIILDLENKTIGFIVDEVSEVLRISNSILEPPPDMVGDVDTDYITAVAKLENRLLILLDIEKALKE